MSKQRFDRSEIQKAPTGISGLDDITNGGLPLGRPTLVSGGPGSGKTLLGVSFLVNGAQFSGFHMRARSRRKGNLFHCTRDCRHLGKRQSLSVEFHRKK